MKFMFSLLLLFSAAYHLDANAAKPGPTNTGPHTTNPNDAYENTLAPCLLDSSCPFNLTPYTGPKTITTDGQIYRNVLVSGRVTLQCSNCGFENSVFDGGYDLGPEADNGNLRGINAFEGTAGSGRSGRVVNYNEFKNYFGQAVYLQNGEANYNYIHSQGADAFNIGENVDVIGNWSEKLGYITGSHADIIQSVLGSNIRVIGNHFDCDFQGELKCSAAVLFQAANANQDNILVEGNWLNGGNNTVHIDKHPHLGPSFRLTNARLVNNLFGPPANGNPGNGAGGSPRYAHVSGSDIAVKSCNRRESDLEFIANFTQNTTGCPPPPTGANPGDVENPSNPSEPVDNTPDTVAQPTLSPQGGAFASGEQVSVSLSSAAGNNIFYTLDGSTPTSSSLSYQGPITINSTTTVKAIAISGPDSSSVVESAFLFGEFVTQSEWNSLGVSSDGDTTYNLRFAATPQGNLIDSVIGIGDQAGNDYADLAAIVRFAPTGFIDARNGNSYSAENQTPYTAGSRYEIRLSVDLSNKRYSAWVIDESGSLTRIANNFAFRSEQANTNQISHLSFVSRTGSAVLSNVESEPVAPEATSVSID